MGVSICFASGKGGVGKSTIVANLGIALSRYKLRTVMVDGNLEGPSLGLILGIKPNIASLHDVLSGEIGVESAMVKVEDVDVVIGELKVEGLLDINFELFERTIEKLEKKYEVVIVDCPPGLGRAAVVAISSCYEMVLVVTPEITSISEALKTVIIAKKLGTKIIGAVINKAGSKYDIPPERISDILELPIMGVLPEEEEIRRSLMEGKPIILLKPGSKFSRGIGEVAAKLMERIYPYKPVP
jgi:septum site-determining protein MinD